MSKFLDLEGLGYYTQCFKPGLAEVIDEGAKNLLDCSINALKQRLTAGTWSNNVYTLPTGDITLTVSSDNTITVSATNITTNETITIGYVEINMGELYFSCTPNEEGAGTKFRSGVNYVGYDDGEGINVPNQTTRRAIQLEIVGSSDSPTTISNIVYKPMLCTKSKWNISTTYQPYKPSTKPIINNGSFAIGTDYTLINDLTITMPTRIGGVVGRISAMLYYNSSRPAGIIVSLSNNSSDFNTSTKVLAKVETTDDVLLLNTSFLIENRSFNSRPIYIWLKSKTASNNRAVAVFEELNL